MRLERMLWCLSSDAGIQDYSLIIKVCLSPEVENQTFLSILTCWPWSIGTQNNSGCSRCHNSESTGVPRVPPVCPSEPGNTISGFAQRCRLSVPRRVSGHYPTGPGGQLLSASWAVSPCVFPNYAVSSSDVGPVCALETTLHAESCVCSWDHEGLQVLHV